MCTVALVLPLLLLIMMILIIILKEMPRGVKCLSGTNQSLPPSLFVHRRS